MNLFEEFFSSGRLLEYSPFIMPSSHVWGKNLILKASIGAAFSLLISFLLLSVNPQLSLFFLTLTYFLAGIPSLISAIEDLLQLEINIDVLMVLAAFLSVFIGSGHEGALLLVLFSFSGAMEKGVSARAKHALYSLQSLCPTKAFVMRENGSLIERAVGDIEVDTLIHVKAGQIVPLDGVVERGSSFVNLVHLTGENVPVSKQVGDTVAAGANNLDGALTLRVTAPASRSTLTQIIEMITSAEEAKPKLSRWFDTFSHRYATTIISLALLFALTFPLLLHIPFFGAGGSIYRALTFLIAASPCALILAMPIAYLSAIGSLAKKGIMLKGGIVLDTLAECDKIAFDKTGTLTTGELELTHIDNEKEETLAIALALEQNADHPIATAICTRAAGITPATLTSFKAHFGHGVEGEYEGKKVFLGRPPFVYEQMENPPSLKESEAIVALLLVGDEISTLYFKDALRPSAFSMIQALGSHYTLAMLTGDHTHSARLVAEELGIKNALANLTPGEKLKYISKEERLIMVGDGINDAPALARAAVGISMGGVGTTTAIDVSDVVLLNDNLDNIPLLLKKAKRCSKIVKQNVTLAMLAMLAAVVPALLGWIPLWLAVVLHEGGTVIVGLNALRLLKNERRFFRKTAKRSSLARDRAV